MPYFFCFKNEFDVTYQAQEGVLAACCFVCEVLSVSIVLQVLWERRLDHYPVPQAANKKEKKLIFREFINLFSLIKYLENQL